MPKQGGQGKGKPKKGDRDLGKALLRKQAQGYQGLNGGKANQQTDMRSILDNSALDDYIITAEMGDEEVEVRRYADDAFLVESASAKNIQSLSLSEFQFQHLVIPRKPDWNVNMTADEVDYNEKKAFLQWRRDIAALECNNSGAIGFKVTPFEKNLDVWRQLWRAVERSELIVQIVDARNPLLYFTNDLMKYVSELKQPKPMMLLINKSDFLTEFHRLAWVKKFKHLNIKFVFYSAKFEQDKLDEALETENLLTEEELNYCVDNVLDGWNITSQGVKSEASDDKSVTVFDEINQSTNNEQEALQTRILNRKELLAFMDLLSVKLNLVAQQKNKGRVCIGMVGYPNVGKSSVINTLLAISKSSHGVVRVGVSSTPGKTKHFQTIMLSETLMLCDCPGLVFPSFMNNTGEMICAGILPINQMRDYIEPARVIASRVPMHLLEAAYGMHVIRELDLMDDKARPPTPHEVLCAYCAVKGYVTSGTGRWDEFRACKDLLRDFTDGRILYVAPPCDMSELSAQDSARWVQETEKIMKLRAIVAERLAVKQMKTIAEHIAEHGGESGNNEGDDEMVFGDGDYNNQSSDEEEEQGSDDSDEEGEANDAVAPLKQPKAHPASSKKTLAAANAKAKSSVKSVSVAGGDEDDEEDSPLKREHKRLKHWGKKNKKLRDKNPYGEDHGTEAYVIYSNTRHIKPVGGGV